MAAIMDRYLSEVRAHLEVLPADSLAEIDRELRSHFADGARHGRDAAAVATALGAPDALARAYLREHAAAGRPRQVRLDALFRVAGLLGLLGFPSVILVTVLSVIGVACVVVGIGTFLAALAAPILPADLVPADFNRVQALLWGVPIASGGVIALVALWLYARVLSRLVAQTRRGVPLSIDASVLPHALRLRSRNRSGERRQETGHR